MEQGQSIFFSGVGAHFQNGVAERSIKQVVETARAMMLHASLHWPDAFQEDLWPFAMDHACWLWNNTPSRESGLSPFEVLSGSVDNCKQISRSRVWGCPAYVLDPKLQDGKKIPKWKPRSRGGMFLGFSPEHSSTVALILSFQSGYVSPQYHVVFDELFQTVYCAGETNNSTTWIDLFDLSRDCYLDQADLDRDHYPDELQEDFWTDAEVEYHRKARAKIRAAPPPSSQLESAVFDADDPTEAVVVYDALDRGGDGDDEALGMDDESDDETDSDDDEDDDQGQDRPALGPQIGHAGGDDTETVVQANPRRQAEAWTQQTVRRSERIAARQAAAAGSQEAGPRRSPRIAGLRAQAQSLRTDSSADMVGKGSRIMGNSWVMETPYSPRFAAHRMEIDVSDVAVQNANWSPQWTPSTFFFDRLDTIYTDPDTDEIEQEHPFAYAAKVSSQDAPTIREVMNLPRTEQEKWEHAMTDEYQALLDKGTFEPIPRSMVPAGEKVVPSTWVFKIKRAVDMTIRKYKARFCVRGDRQDLTTEDGEELNVYAPVVQWSTIRLVFNLMIAHDLKSTQIDFRNAFVQSTLPTPIYLELPVGIEVAQGKSAKDHVLKVYKSLYGDRRAPQLWYKHLAAALESQGYKPSEHDPCLFIRGDSLVLVFVDDCIICSKSQTVIDSVIKRLEDDGFDLDPERGDLAGFLGIKIEKELGRRGKPTGNLLLTQNALIERILKVLKLSESKKTKMTPATEPLRACKDCPRYKEDWNYRSVEGMMLYLGMNTRPEISMAVHQCARFANDPKDIHAKALIHIGQYLLATRHKGMILSPNRKALSLDMFCDADFAGLSNVEDRQDPNSAKSRTGFLIVLGGAPVVWMSKLQTEIATSTCEAEYIALSTGMRSLLPLKAILEEITSALELPSNTSSMISTVYEDNTAALKLATTDPPKISSRTKHINVKYHWFRSHLKKGYIEVKKIDTKDQAADIFTKPLVQAKFEPLRKLLLGW